MALLCTARVRCGYYSTFTSSCLVKPFTQASSILLAFTELMLVFKIYVVTQFWSANTNFQRFSRLS
jgi:hypothetical protein